MAQSDANEQVKEILRQIIKHRFWIAIGFACLFAVIAYFMGSGPVQAEAKKEIDKITGAEKGVKAYNSPAKPTGDYKPIVEEKTAIVAKDVNKAWKELYDRQKDLLTWPDVAKENIAKWGREYPKDQDAGRVQIAIVDYIQAYPSYVDMVYKVFDPFDYETGKGIVAAPPKDVLLRPAPFAVENTKLPTLGAVWAAQERLWVQRTMLEVIHQVNKQAKDWDSAIIKEIRVLEVGNSSAQDQRSLAKGETLTKAPDVLSPEQEAAAAASASDSSAGSSAGPGSAQMGMRMQMMGNMGGGGAAVKADDGIYYIGQADASQYKILPVMITVLIEQDRVQDLLVEMENSPMSIQVKDLELERPSSAVTKPEKGEGGANMGMMMGGGMMRGMMGRGFGGMASQMNDQMMRMGGMRGMGVMSGQMAQRGNMGMMMGGGATVERKKGVDVRNVNREAERKKKQEELEKRQGPSLFDPYFNIVQVTVYGQARFYNRPPAEAEGEVPQSPGEAAATPATPGAAPATPGAAPNAAPGAPTAADKAQAPADEKAKAEAPPAGKAQAPAPDAKSAKDQPAAAGTPAKSADEKPAAKPGPDAKPAAPGNDASGKDAPDAATKK